MTDRPTPETDAFSVKFKSICGSKAWVPTDICRRFERERNELLAYLDADHYANCNAELRRERDEAREKYHQICSQTLIEINKAHEERDEAREALENHMAATIHTCHDECKRPMCVLRRERDEAREELKQLKDQYGR